MKITTLSLSLAAVLALAGSAVAAGTRTYQVTGPVMEVTDTMIAVKKGAERWEIARDSSSNASSPVKVGEKVTVTYTMTATKIESKADGNEKSKGSTPSASPAKK